MVRDDRIVMDPDMIAQKRALTEKASGASARLQSAQRLIKEIEEGKKDLRQQKNNVLKVYSKVTGALESLRNVDQWIETQILRDEKVARDNTLSGFYREALKKQAEARKFSSIQAELENEKERIKHLIATNIPPEEKWTLSPPTPLEDPTQSDELEEHVVPQQTDQVENDESEFESRHPEDQGDDQEYFDLSVLTTQVTDASENVPRESDEPLNQVVAPAVTEVQETPILVKNSQQQPPDIRNASLEQIAARKASEVEETPILTKTSHQYQDTARHQYQSGPIQRNERRADYPPSYGNSGDVTMSQDDMKHLIATIQGLCKDVAHVKERFNALEEAGYQSGPEKNFSQNFTAPTPIQAPPGLTLGRYVPKKHSSNQSVMGTTQRGSGSLTPPSVEDAGRRAAPNSHLVPIKEEVADAYEDDEEYQEEPAHQTYKRVTNAQGKALFVPIPTPTFSDSSRDRTPDQKDVKIAPEIGGTLQKPINHPKGSRSRSSYQEPSTGVSDYETTYEGELEQFERYKQNMKVLRDKKGKKLAPKQPKIQPKSSDSSLSSEDDAAGYETAQTHVSGAKGAPTRAKVNLRPIELQKFSGKDPHKFQEWFLMFQALYMKNAQLDDLTRFYYLKQHLTEDASSLLDAIDLRPGNLKVAIRILKHNYAKDSRPLERLHHAFATATVDQKDYSQMLADVNKIAGLVFQLKKNGGSTSEPTIYRNFLSKLPVELRREVLRKVENKKFDGSFSKVYQWTQDAIRMEIKLVEDLERNGDAKRVKDFDIRELNVNVAYADGKRNQKTTQFFRSEGSQPAENGKDQNKGSGKGSCCFHIDNESTSHSRYKCTRSPSECYHIAKIKGLCLLCLRPGHGIKDCPESNNSQYRCRVSGCGALHATVFHEIFTRSANRRNNRSYGNRSDQYQNRRPNGYGYDRNTPQNGQGQNSYDPNVRSEPRRPTPGFSSQSGQPGPSH